MTAFCYPTSPNFLPDPSDNLEIDGIASMISEPIVSSSNFDSCVLNANHRQSGISVGFLGSCIRRQYRSTFLLSDDQMVGVTRSETFHPENTRADVQVNLSLFKPINESIIPSRRRFQSVPSLIRDSLGDDSGRAHLMLTTDRSRDSELLGHIGGRYCFTKNESCASYFHRRTTALRKEEGCFNLHTPLNASSSLDRDLDSQPWDRENFNLLVTGEASDTSPSTERMEKDTHPNISRHQGYRCFSLSPLGRVSLSDKASQTGDDSETGTATPTQDYKVGANEKYLGSASQLPARHEKPLPPQGVSTGSLSSNSFAIKCSRRASLTVPSLDVQKVRLSPDTEELEVQPDDALSHPSTFRSPFDPRSDGDFVSTPESDAGERQHGLPGDDNEVEELLDETDSDTRFNQHGEDSANEYSVQPQPAPRGPRKGGYRMSKESPRLDPPQSALDEEDDDNDSWVDEESRLRPPALPVNFEAVLAGLPVEDIEAHTKRLRPLQYPLYVNVDGNRDGIGGGTYSQARPYRGARPLETRDQNVPEDELPENLVVRTRRRTMSGVTGFLPYSSTLSSSSIWFGDHAVPTTAQLYAAEHSPLRLSSIQLQAQAEIARRRSRNTLAARSLSSVSRLGRSRSLERSRALGPSGSVLYGPTGRRMHGGAALVERAIERHASKRDGHETISLIHIPRLDDETSSAATVTVTERNKLGRPASSASVAMRQTSRLNALNSRDEARSLIAQAAVDLATHTYDISGP